MATPDLVIRNARIVDGTGAAAFTGDVALSGDRIVEVGAVGARGAEEIDAGGLVLAPGFIDIHTHYDAQLCWDRLATPSLEHGVTTVITGNCSFSLAPVRPGASGPITRLFNKVEDIPVECFDAAVPYSWESFAEYMDYVRPDLGINVGALVGHSALRSYVMGEAAQQRIATDDEIARMCEVLKGAMEAGALGLSISYGDTDENGRPVPPRFADLREKIALCSAMMETGRGALQADPDFLDIEQKLANLDELGEISLATGIMCSALPIMDSPMQHDFWQRMLRRVEELQRRGARVYGQTLTRSFDWNFQLAKPVFFLYLMPEWGRVMMLSQDQRVAALRDAALRPVLSEELDTKAELVSHARLARVFSPENERFIGMKLPQIAELLGCSLSDALIHVSLNDELQSEFEIREAVHHDIDVVMQMLDHPCVQVGGSDAGAHISQFAGVGDSSYLFERFVRKTGRMSLERAVQRITGEPAQQWNIHGRGEIRAGNFADLVLFDPDTITRGEEQLIADVPGGVERYVRYPTGIDRVFVNGACVLAQGRYTGRRSGRFV
jgi:N-acyl-D-aspartate/D-glutamate deacylase